MKIKELSVTNERFLGYNAALPLLCAKAKRGKVEKKDYNERHITKSQISLKKELKVTIKSNWKLTPCNVP